MQSLTDQEQSLQKQEIDQQEKVKSIVPDEKVKKELQKKVAAFKKGNFAVIDCNYNI